MAPVIFNCANDGIETMRLIQKGQVRYVGKDVVKKNSFIRSLFRLAA
jgi:hypothetical protein